MQIDSVAGMCQIHHTLFPIKAQKANYGLKSYPIDPDQNHIYMSPLYISVYHVNKMFDFYAILGLSMNDET